VRFEVYKAVKKIHVERSSGLRSRVVLW